MSNSDKSVLIIGAGTFGLSAAHHLARAGYKSITVLEKGDSIPAPLSAGNDINKIIRGEYEDPFYSDLALAAMSEWANNPIFAPHYHQTGYLLGNSAAAPEKSKRSLAKSLESIKAHPAWSGKISPVRSREDIRRAAPALTGPMDGWEGYFNQFAGYVHAANALTSVYKSISKLGVRVLTGEAVTRLVYEGERCTGADTATGKRFTADVVVLTLGASLGRVLPAIGRQVTAKAWSVVHVQLSKDEAARLKGIPVTYARDLGFFFEPEPGTGLLKICPSGAGYTNYESESGLSVPPDYNDFIPPADEKLARRLLQETLPEYSERPFINKHICWCADTADSDYVIDLVPGTKNLFVATGDSGHAFKMLPVVGSWIKDAVEKGGQDIPRWKWKAGTDAGGNVSWRTGQVTDLKHVGLHSKL